MAPQMTDKSAELDLPQVACAFVKLNATSTKMMNSIAERLPHIVPRMNDWGLCALAWSFGILENAGKRKEFYQQVLAEVKRRRLSWATVKSSQLGPEFWRARRQ